MSASASAAGARAPAHERALSVTILLFTALAVAALAITCTLWPLPTLGVVAGAVLLAVAVVRLDVAILLFAAAVPLEYSISIGGIPQLTVVKIAGALCLLSLVINLLAGRRRIRLDASHALLFGILGLLLLSTVLAQSLDTALLVALRYLNYVGIFFVLTTFAGDHRTLERVIAVLSISSAVAGMLAVVNLLTGFDSRATPTYGDANDLAYILSTTLPLTLWLLRRPSLLWRLFVLALAVVIGTADLLTFSRGAAFGLGCALLWFAFTQRRRLLVAAAPLALVVAALGVVAVAEPSTVSTALTDKAAVADVNVAQRLNAWRSALEIIVTHPLFGVGPGNFQFVTAAIDGRPPTPSDPTVVHDAYLDVGAELGVPALALLIAYLVVSFRRLRLVMAGGHGPPQLALAVTASLIVAVTATLTLSEQYYAPLWVDGAIATCLWQGVRMPRMRTRRPALQQHATAPVR